MKFTGTTVLLSFAYAKTKMMDRVAAAAADGADIIIDSGAFTAWRAGKSVDLNAYAEFLRALPFKPLFAVTLDVIGDPVATQRNTERLRDLGANVVPVVTRGANAGEVAVTCAGADIVALGGLVGTPRNNGYVKHLMETAPAVRWHWLGFANIALIARYRPFSCDISTWHASLRRGATVMAYLGRGKRLALQPYAFARQPTAQVEALVKSYGFATRDFSHLAAWHGDRSTALVLNAQSFLRFTRDIRTEFGTRIAFASISPAQMDVLRIAVEQEYDLTNKKGA